MSTSISALDHVAEALARLPVQFQEKPKFEALLTALVNPAQDIENAAIDVITLRAIATAFGQQLDDLGALIGRERNGIDDATYRRYLYAQAMVNRSNGTINELIRVGQLVLGVPATGIVFVRCISDATFIYEVRDFPVSEAVAAVLEDMLFHAVSDGVRIVVEYSNVSLSQTFRFDAGPSVPGAGLDLGHLAGAADDV